MSTVKREHKVKGTRRTPAAAANNATRRDPQEDSSVRLEQVRELAYYKAERRGFVPGFEQQDWLEAEGELQVS